MRRFNLAKRIWMARLGHESAVRRCDNLEDETMPRWLKRGMDAGAIKAAHPDFRYQPLSRPEVTGDGGRLRWVSGSPGKPPAYAGTDFIIARDGKIATVHLFFDKLP